MSNRSTLERWVSLERGDGVKRAERASRYLSIGALALCIFVVTVGLIVDIRYLAIGVPSMLIGWLLAERNALESRARMWPAFRRYIDWERVDKDLAEDERDAT